MSSGGSRCSSSSAPERQFSSWVLVDLNFWIAFIWFSSKSTVLSKGARNRSIHPQLRVSTITWGRQLNANHVKMQKKHTKVMSFWPTEGPLPILIASKDDMKRYEEIWNMHRWMQYEDFHVGILHGWWSWSEVLSGWDPRLATHVLGGLAKAQTQGPNGCRLETNLENQRHELILSKKNNEIRPL